jgi:hypothetical protein
MRRNCQWCKTSFIATRADTKFCTELCKQASHRRKKKARAAIEAAEVFRKKEQETQNAVQLFEAYQAIASFMTFCDLRMMGTPGGIIAVEVKPGALKILKANDRWDRWTLSMMSETRHLSKDILAGLPEPDLGKSFIRREAETEFRDILRANPDRLVSLFRWERRDVPLLPWAWAFCIAEIDPPMVASSWADDDEDEELDAGGTREAVEDFLSADGCQIESG